MDVYVMGVSIHPAADVISDARLEEMAYRTARAALDDAGIERRQIDHVTLAGSDEIDARGISSMLLAAPSGAYLKDEMRVSDSGLTGLHLGAMRVASGHLQLGLVVSWNQSSVGPLEDIGRMRAEPFFLRPIGLNFAIADGLFASAMAERHGITERAVGERVRLRLAAAAKNPRAVRRAVPELDAMQAGRRVAVNPSGGAWAQNPYFCTGLVHAAEAALQVAGRAGGHQVAGARRALAHGTSGFAQQTHGFVVMEGVEA